MSATLSLSKLKQEDREFEVSLGSCIMYPFLARANNGGYGAREMLSDYSTCCSCRGPEFVPSTYVWWFTATSNSNSGRSETLFWPLEAPPCTHLPMYKQKHFLKKTGSPMW